MRAPIDLGSRPFGIVEWFRPGEHERVEHVLDGMQRLGIDHLRVGVSWADSHRADGLAWLDWLLPRLAGSATVLPCATYTPPSLGIEATSASPPRDLKAYADFVDLLITRYGGLFSWIELWNEPNNDLDWDWRLDPEWTRFAEMVGGAAYWARQRGKKTVLGGMCPVDPNWLEVMAGHGALHHFDAVGLHGFPNTWEHSWPGWRHLLDRCSEVLARHGLEPELWISETGYSTWRHDEHEQIRWFLAALEAPAQRVYWYAYEDLAPDQPSLQGLGVDEREYHCGLVRADGRPKLLHRLLEDGGVELARAVHGLAAPQRLRRERATLIFGGAGFIGTNLADRVARSGGQVLVVDNLSRPGVEANARWLIDQHGAAVDVVPGDIRNHRLVHDLIGEADRVFHLAAQTAVTTSLELPVDDFEVNAAGTLNVLEGLRRCAAPPPFVATSTNKVYGKLAGIEIALGERRYQPFDQDLRAHGVDETQTLDFRSPYGCSKGAADQYVLDYARVFDLPAAVFRMSCIYGPHQCGTEDQGWVAHFVKAALAEEEITIFGDGHQVRDVLYVSDLVDALLLASEHIAGLKGLPFNVGGGPGQAVTLLEVVQLVERLTGRRMRLRHDRWRIEDQRWYVSDIRGFERLTGWRPTIGPEAGIGRLAAWVRAQRSAGDATGAAA